MQLKQQYVTTNNITPITTTSFPRQKPNLATQRSHSNRYSPYPANKPTLPATSPVPFPLLDLIQPHPQSPFDLSEFIKPESLASDSPLSSCGDLLTTPDLDIHHDFEMAGNPQQDQNWDFVSSSYLMSTQWRSYQQVANEGIINPLQLQQPLADFYNPQQPATQCDGISPTALSTHSIPSPLAHPTPFATPFTTFGRLPTSLPPAPSLRGAIASPTSTHSSPAPFFSGSALSATPELGYQHQQLQSPQQGFAQMDFGYDNAWLAPAVPQQPQQAQQVIGEGAGVPDGMDEETWKQFVLSFGGAVSPAPPPQISYHPAPPSGPSTNNLPLPHPTPSTTSPSSESSSPSVAPDAQTLTKLERRRSINRKSARTLREKRKTELAVAQDALEAMRGLMEKEREGRRRAEEVLRMVGLQGAVEWFDWEC